jgi:hypothetical protein
VIWDETEHAQRMWIMYLVWPLVTLSGGPIAVWLYRKSRHYGNSTTPFPLAVASATCHCGAGCTLGDLVAESIAFSFPGVLVLFGLDIFFQQKIFATWVLDLVCAFLLGVVFQYFTIAPMRHLGLKAGIIAALKADALSLIAWQTGMYAMMAAGQFAFFTPMTGKVMDASSPEFWFLMQLAMIAGFFTSYPVNWLLLKIGLKERM